MDKGVDCTQLHVRERRGFQHFLHSEVFGGFVEIDQLKHNFNWSAVLICQKAKVVNHLTASAFQDKVEMFLNVLTLNIHIHFQKFIF